MKPILMIFVLALLTISCAQKPKETTQTGSEKVELSLHVQGMTCEHCEMSVKKSVQEITGVDSVAASHLDSTAFVRFDPAQTNRDVIVKAIEKRGYTVK